MVAAFQSVAKDMLFAPIYLYQGQRVKRTTLRLPEPEGARSGQVPLGLGVAADISAFATALTNAPFTELPFTKISAKKTLHLMIVGDSAAAGVGTSLQQEALAGKLIPALQQQSRIYTQFDALIWSLQATSGHTSFDMLRRLYVLPAPSEPIDVMVLIVGVNDTISNVSTATWCQQIEQIITIAQRKFGVGILLFSSLPPMAQMPALPAPLNAFIGAKAKKLDQALRQVCAAHHGVHYLAADFTLMAESYSQGPVTKSLATKSAITEDAVIKDTVTEGTAIKNTVIDSTMMFARDGFHPSSLTYAFWAELLAERIAELISPAAARP